MPSTTVLYRPSWQRLRVSFLSTNHPEGGFTTIAGTNDNLKRLDNYLHDGNPEHVADWTKAENLRMGFTDEEEYACRIWRALNLLNAVRMGYSGQMKRGSDHDEAVRQYRDSIQPLYNGNVVVIATRDWKWDVVQYELETMWREDRFWFTAIYTDLRARAYRAGRKRDITSTRGDLLHMIEIMDAVNRHGE